MSKKIKVHEPQELYEVISRCSESDFDGHSMFHAFTTRQRLEWLDLARATMLELKEVSDHKGQ